MIADQQVGKSFMGALGYNLKKLDHPDKNKRAVLLDSNFAANTWSGIKKEVDMVRELRPNLGRYVYHTSLNFLPEEVSALDNEKLVSIAYDYLAAMGFDNNQYLIFRHFDTDHPHLHLLVNRITFDGEVVSDSNNFKRSEAILRKLEYKYNLIPVEQSTYVAYERRRGVTSKRRNGVTDQRSNSKTGYPDNHVTKQRGNKSSSNLNNHATSYRGNGATGKRNNHRSGYQGKDVTDDPGNAISTQQGNRIAISRRNHTAQRPPRRGEIEKTLRTGKPSDKMLLQEMLKNILVNDNLTIQDFIRRCEAKDIHLLFNQASTGHISGITYFHGSFKAKGQALGTAFKWAEIIKQLDYEQDRDRKAISQANSRTRAIYGKEPANRNGGHGLRDSSTADTEFISTKSAAVDPSGENISNGSQKTTMADRNDPDRDRRSDSFNDHLLFDGQGIEISDDIDDEAVLGMNRKRQDKPRKNRK